MALRRRHTVEGSSYSGGAKIFAERQLILCFWGCFSLQIAEASSNFNSYPLFQPIRSM